MASGYDLIPSINNMVANRMMLFDELFINLTKGFRDANYLYVNLCFGHLLATFLYASRTSDDLLEDQNPGITRAIHFMEQNLDKKITLEQIAQEAGYSASYFIAIFSKQINYSPLSYYSHLKIDKACEYLDFSKPKNQRDFFCVRIYRSLLFLKRFPKKDGFITP